MPKPFLKWVGGKGKLLPELHRVKPEHYSCYVEPFAGGAAFFFDLDQEVPCLLNDMNFELISTYVQIRDDVEGVIKELHGIKRRVEKEGMEKTFYETRAAFNESRAQDRLMAARFIFLNKTCFNGLWRTNKAGKLNTPWNKSERIRFIQEDILREASEKLTNTVLTCGSYKDAVKSFAEGSFVYMDPPYLGNFSSFTKEPFGIEQHTELAEVATELVDRGVHVVISNSNHPYVREIYQHRFNVEVIQAPRSVSAKGTGRKAVEELLIWARGWRQHPGARGRR